MSAPLDQVANRLDELATCLGQLAQALREAALSHRVPPAQEGAHSPCWTSWPQMQDALEDDLSSRAIDVLWRMDVRSVEQILTLGRHQLLRVRNCGSVTTGEILDYIADKKFQRARQKTVVGSALPSCCPSPPDTP